MDEQSRYLWADTDVQVLRDAAQSVHDALVKASAMVTQLIADMEADEDWQGLHKTEFMAWMSLLKQYHAKMADQAIGEKAVQALDGFLSSLAGYYQNSAVYAMLRAV